MEQPTAPVNPSEPTQVLPSTAFSPTAVPPQAAPPGVPTPDARDSAGKPFGRYRLLEELGHGGMGVVWRAWDTQLRREVALKQIQVRERGDEAYIQRFLREAQLAARLRHPGIVAVHDVGVLDGQHFLTTDYIAGRTLGETMGEGVPLRSAVAWVKEVADALASAHGQGVIHRDVKPENLIVDAEGHIYVTDFGLAKEVDLGPESEGARLTAHGAIVGTPQYMSPEQAAGRTEALTPATDQFSLGVVLYELLAKKLPFQGRGLRDLLNAITEAEPAPLRRADPSIPVDLETICLKTLSKNPEERYASAGELAADLKRFLDGDPILARPMSALGTVVRRAWRNRVATLAVAAALAVVTGVSAWAVIDSRRREGQALAERRERDRAERELREALDLMERGRAACDRASRCLYQETTADEAASQAVDEGISLLSQAAARVPERALPHLLLGRAWELKGRDDQAEHAYREAIRVEPTFGPARWQLGRLLILRAYLTKMTSPALSASDKKALNEEVQEIVADARGQFEAAFRDSVGWGEERDLSERLATAMAAHMAEDFERSREVCREAIRGERREGLEEFYWILGCASEGKERVDALSIAVEIRPKFAVALMCRGNERFLAGDHEQALDDLDKALRINPRLAQARLVHGVVRLRMGEEERALEDFDGFLRLVPRHAVAMNYRGVAFLRMGDYEQAIEAYTEAASLDPSYTDPILGRGSAKIACGEIKGGLTDVADGLRRSPTDWEGREAWEQVYYEGLAVAFRRSPDILADWVVAAMEATEAIGNADYPKARELYEKALRTGAEKEEADLVMRRLVRTVHYNLACIESLLSAGKEGPRAQAKDVTSKAAKGHRDAAFERLKKSMDLGVKREQVVDDEDFTPLREDPRWAELVGP